MEDTPAPGPQPIRRLTESLINRIAAGEIIHRPASALKELLENSLDAKSTSIRITVKDGGLKLLQIQDNGTGIRKSDLPILAERFTTSKISKFSDLSSLSTYGFRGEALASISYVAQLSVVTKTANDSCAWKATYTNGKMTTDQPKPCAGNDGTTITIENLFYNTPTRLSALRSPSDEYARILDVITKYAVHNPTVAFMCKKSSSATASLTTPSSSTTQQAIRMLYGHSIAKELINVSVDDSHFTEDLGEWKADVYITSANYQAKKTVFVLFINHRLVESSRLKRALESIYTGILPKGSFPFVYLSLLIAPENIDVNVHPTKSAVHFLNEDAIVESITSKLLDVLAKKSNSRDFEVGRQTYLTDLVTIEASSSKTRPQPDESTSDTEDTSSTPAAKKKIYSQHKVRTSLQDQTLDSMFPIVNPSQVDVPRDKGKGKARENSVNPDSPEPPTIFTKSKIMRDVKESECYLTSVRNLRSNIAKEKHKSLTEVLSNQTFVGIVDLDKALSLIQHSTRLYLVNHGAVAEELFYQLGLRQFGDIPKIKLQPAPPIKALLKLAVDAEDIPNDGELGTTLSKDEIVEKITDILIARRDMLSEYFSLCISAEGDITSIPHLLPGYTPNLDKLPCFLMRLGPQVDWTSELSCFDTFLHELAYFYIPGPGPLVDLPPEECQSTEDIAMEDQTLKAERWQIQHVLFPAFRRYLSAPKGLLNTKDVVQVANLPDLYKVFERC